MFCTFPRNAYLFSIKLTHLIKKNPVHEENNETISYKVNLSSINQINQKLHFASNLQIAKYANISEESKINL